MDMTWILAGAAINLALLILFFISLSRIESNTRQTQEKLDAVIGELQGLNGKAYEVKRDGIVIQQAVQHERNHG